MKNFGFASVLVTIALGVTLPIAQSHAGPTLDTVKINDVDDLDGCYAIKPYIQTTKQDSKSDHSMVDVGEIYNACTDKAVDLAKKNGKDQKKILEIAESVRRNHRSGSSLKVFGVLLGAHLTAEICDNSEMFKAIVEGLSHPIDFPTKKDSDAKNSLGLIEKCLKFGQFKDDIKDELQKENSYVRDNLCPFLKERKIVKECLKS